MKKHISFWLRGLVASAALALACTTAALAQGPPTTGPAPQDPTAVPLDGGASLLLAAGVGLGIRRLRSKLRVKS